jgi:hypothetical protein
LFFYLFPKAIFIFPLFMWLWHFNVIVNVPREKYSYQHWQKVPRCTFTGTSEDFCFAFWFLSNLVNTVSVIHMKIFYILWTFWITFGWKSWRFKLRCFQVDLDRVRTETSKIPWDLFCQRIMGSF